MIPGIVRVGVQAIVSSKTELLLIQRSDSSSFEPGTWGLPGGSLEPGETIVECALRELREETGLVAANPRIVALTDPAAGANHHMQIGVEMQAWSGSPRAADSTEVADARFFDKDSLPTPLFAPSATVLAKYLAGVLY